MTQSAYPAGAPAPAQPVPVTLPAPASKAVGIVFGLLLLLTIGIPFAISGGKPVWSWDVIKIIWEQIGQKTPMAIPQLAFLIGAWAIGLAAMIVGSAMRRMPLAICYLILGIGAVVLLFVVPELAQKAPTLTLQSIVPLPFQLFCPTLAEQQIKWLTPKRMELLGLCLMALFLIILAIRGRLGGKVVVCIVQILICGAFTAYRSLVLYDSIRAAGDVPQGAGAYAWTTIIVTLILLGLQALGGLFAFAHGFAFGTRRRGGLTAAAKVLVYISLLGVVVYNVVAPAINAKSWAMLLNGLPLTIMLVCLLLIALEAVAAFFSSLASPSPAVAAAAPAATPPGGSHVPAPGGDVSERLRHLDGLRARGAISSEEYTEQRGRILGQL